MKHRTATDWVSIITNLGVIAGLVLVAYEVRQATLQAGADASQVFTSNASSARMALALSPDLADIYLRASENGVATLSPVEKFRLSEWAQATRMRMLGNVIQFRRGFLERGAVRAMLPTLIERENGVWADLGIPPVNRDNWPEIAEIQEEMGLSDQ